MKKTLLIGFVFVSFATSFAATEEDGDILLREDAEISYASPLDGGIDLQYVPIRYPSYAWTNTQRSTEAGQGVHIGLEWLPLEQTPIKHRFGKPVVGLGGGFHQIKNIPMTDLNTVSHLYVAPFGAHIGYRADFLETQVLVPFFKVGLGVSLANQDTPLPQGLESTHYTFYSWDYSVGLEFCMSVLDRKSARSLDSYAGINNTYLIFEYANSDSLTASNVKDLTHGEYRIGLRFEI